MTTYAIYNEDGTIDAVSSQQLDENWVEVPEGTLPYQASDELWVELRAKRDRLLRDSDPQALPDYPHSSDTLKQAWLDYRTALRALPENTTDPSSPIWPVTPQEGE